MTQTNPRVDFYMVRETADRRVATNSQLPYSTEEGLVLFDRREGRDRRSAPRQQQAQQRVALNGSHYRITGTGY